MTDDVDPRKIRRRDKLFEFRTGQHRWRCELVDLASWGLDCRFYHNEEFHHGRHFDHADQDGTLARDLAIAWAHRERAAIEKGRA